MIILMNMGCIRFQFLCSLLFGDLVKLPDGKKVTTQKSSYLVSVSKGGTHYYGLVVVTLVIVVNLTH